MQMKMSTGHIIVQLQVLRIESLYSHFHAMTEMKPDLTLCRGSWS